MEAPLRNADYLSSRVKATFCLGSETYLAQANKGLISEQLSSVKEKSMSILKDFVTKNNIPNEVPDDLEEVSSEDEDEDEDEDEEEISKKPPVKKSKKQNMG